MAKLETALRLISAASCDKCLLMAADYAAKLPERDKSVARWAYSYAEEQIAEQPLGLVPYAHG